MRESAKRNLTRYVIEDEGEISKVMKEADYFSNESFLQAISDDLYQPRMLSIKQVKDLVYSYLHIS